MFDLLDCILDIWLFPITSLSFDTFPFTLFGIFVLTWVFGFTKNLVIPGRL